MKRMNTKPERRTITDRITFDLMGRIRVSITCGTQMEKRICLNWMEAASFLQATHDKFNPPQIKLPKGK
jgi:hypothetical protein